LRKKGANEVEAKRRGDENRRQYEACLDDAIWQRPRAGLAFRTGVRSRLLNKPIAASQEYECRRDKVGLIGRKPREVSRSMLR
jgi:hypothetical protein